MMASVPVSQSVPAVSRDTGPVSVPVSRPLWGDTRDTPAAAGQSEIKIMIRPGHWR
jgi:hypothetical protein